MSEPVDFSWLPGPLPAEIVELSQQYGEPLYGSLDLGDSSYLRSVVAGRVAVVCMVVRRPSGRIIVFRKPFYPAGVFRLMTGGVEPGERLLDAMLREVYEETGLAVEVARFLGASAFTTDGRPQFASFAFLLDERGGTLGALDPEERVEAFREVDVPELLQIADSLDRLPDEHNAELDGNLAHWGRLRALNHRLAYQILG